MDARAAPAKITRSGPSVGQTGRAPIAWEQTCQSSFSHNKLEFGLAREGGFDQITPVSAEAFRIGRLDDDNRAQSHPEPD